MPVHTIRTEAIHGLGKSFAEGSKQAAAAKCTEAHYTASIED